MNKPCNVFDGVEWEQWPHIPGQWLCTVAGIECRMWTAEEPEKWGASWRLNDNEQGVICPTSELDGLEFIRSAITSHFNHLARILGGDMIASTLPVPFQRMVAAALVTNLGTEWIDNPKPELNTLYWFQSGDVRWSSCSDEQVLAIAGVPIEP